MLLETQLQAGVGEALAVVCRVWTKIEKSPGVPGGVGGVEVPEGREHSLGGEAHLGGHLEHSSTPDT